MKNKILSILLAIMLMTFIFAITSCGEIGEQGVPGENGINGIDGKDGVGISSVTTNEDGNIVINYTDGTNSIIEHDLEFLCTVLPPSCTYKGIDLHYCKNCKFVKVVNTDETEHKYSEWIVDKRPTTKEDGLRHIECIICGTRCLEESIPKLVGENYRLGMGIDVSMNNSRTGHAQVDATVASVVLDELGRIVSCRIDAIQNCMDITDGKVDIYKTYRSKMEWADDYGLNDFGIDNDNNGINLEWYEQAMAFESFVVGMTADEVANIRTQNVNGLYISAEKDLLNAGCTIQITEFISAAVKACNDEQGVYFVSSPGMFKHGVAINTYDNGSRSAGEGYDGTMSMFSDFACTVTANGEIIAALNDGIQPKIIFNAYDEIVSTYYTDTKRTLKKNYGMSESLYSFDGNNDGIVLEWFEQSAVLSKYVVGMTADQVANMETAPNEIGYQMTTDEELLIAGCTIQLTELKIVISKAANYAR